MANIEIHGGHAINGIGSLQITMSEKFREAGLGKEVIITEFKSYPYYCDEPTSTAPFLRIWGETKEEIDGIVEILRGLGITKRFDIETVFVNSFIPKEKMMRAPDSDVCPSCKGNCIGDYPYPCDDCRGTGKLRK